MPPPSSRVLDLRAGIVVVCAFALVTVLFTGLYPPFANPNELSRLQTVFAFVEDGTFAIDRALAVLGDHEDKARSGGRFYSNKAPGLALAAVPVYRALRVVFPRPRSPFDPIFVWVRILTVSSLCVLALARLHARLRFEGAAAAALVAAAAGFGTPYLFYARTFLSHAWTAALLLLSWDLIKLREQWRFRRRANVLVVGAGFLAGWAAISEYPVALLALLLALRAGSRRSWRALALFLAGAAVPAAVLLGYDAVCFGSPFVLSSARESLPQYAALVRSGLFGIGLPRPGIALAYLAHPARGLILFSPFLLWTAAGLTRWRSARHERADGMLYLSAVALFFLLMCGYSNWHGGWSLGNRYLLPVLFFAVLAAARALETPASRWWFAVAAVFSIATHALLTATWPHFPSNVPWPPATASIWFLIRGWISPSLISAAPSAALFVEAVVVALATAVAVAADIPRNRAWWTALGAVPLAATLLFPPRISFGGRLWRAAVFGKYSGRDPGREELRRVMAEASSESERRRAQDAWRLFGPDDMRR